MEILQGKIYKLFDWVSSRINDRRQLILELLIVFLSQKDPLLNLFTVVTDLSFLIKVNEAASVWLGGNH